jgi:biopolymer transport protein ExbB
MTGKVLISIFDSIPLWVMILPILVCSIISFAVAIERILFYKNMKSNYKVLMKDIMDKSSNGDIEKIDITSLNHNGNLFEMIKNILFEWNNVNDREYLIKTESENAIRSIEKFGGVISTIATVAPMLGLLGTVTGMMKSFSGLSGFGSSARDLLAMGIAEALITTTLGLLVAIPTLIFYNYIVSKSNYYISEVEFIANSFLEVK